MKKKYFSPEMEEMEIEDTVLLVTSGCGDESETGSETAGDKPITDFE